MACRLMGTERQVPVARELAVKVKRAERLLSGLGYRPSSKLGRERIRSHGILALIPAAARHPFNPCMVTCDWLQNVPTGTYSPAINPLSGRIVLKIRVIGKLIGPQGSQVTP